jgi:hypothetical protein
MPKVERHRLRSYVMQRIIEFLIAFGVIGFWLYRFGSR